MKSLVALKVPTPAIRFGSGSALTASSRAKTRHVDGASRKREPHDNVQDGAQKNFPSNGFAGHTPSFRLSWIEDTILLSRGTSLYLLLRIIRTLAFPPMFEIRFDCAGSRLLSRRGSRGLLMWADIAGVLVVLSIAILIAHAFDAFRSG